MTESHSFESAKDAFPVKLSNFEGPLDLLLHLIRQHEVDIHDIPIALITAQYLSAIASIEEFDLDVAGEFLVMAATLMEIKSKMLLPRGPEDETADDDPRLELVKQLIEYKKYKEAAGLLEEQARLQMTRLARVPADLPAALDLAHQPLRKVELWDLVSAFGRLMRETAALQPPPIVVDETPIHVHMERIEALLRERGRVSFRELFAPPLNRGRLLGLFLALLELIKALRVDAEQLEPFGEIWLQLPAPGMGSMMGQDASRAGEDGQHSPIDASQ
jgi:segregation and condensation protein A